ncbi:TetR/AcrR family transcriptional regulator [Sneathiella sp.]|jgi:AcrR family transcriptional regulator|uniref:TetR/AcrR family transcriptional regulator n=1 Tax=Sneathiella sp. TaxID=1964365 RepID=UPI0039E3D176
MKKTKTADKIKIAAQTLFADKGIEAVSVREIVHAAGQKNMASLHYYFKTKEALVKELLLDASKAMEDERTVLLDQLEKQGGPATLIEVLNIFIKCAVVSGDDPRNLSNVRLFLLASKEEPKLVSEAIKAHSGGAFFRCLDYMRNFMQHLEPDVIEMRLSLMQVYVFHSLSIREMALTNHRQPALWEGDRLLEELVITTEGLLLA